MRFTKFEELIDFAIKREEEAIDAYGSMSEKANTPGLRDLLLELQEEEKNHKNLLREVTKDKLQSFEATEVIDLKISDYLVEEPVSPDMTFQDLLIFAAKKEQQAVDLYAELGRRAQSGELKKLFDFFVTQEKSHKLKLETEYEKRVLEEG